MMDGNITAVGIGIVVNAIIVAFGYGVLTQKVNGLKELRKEDLKRGHQVLPECREAFVAIHKDLGELKGKVNTLIELVKDGKK